MGALVICLGLVPAIFAAEAMVGPTFAQTTPRWEHYWHSGPGGSWYVRPLSCRLCRDVSNNPVVCDDKHCYGREAVGFGLLPKRSYRVVYAQDEHVCSVIAGALNWALTRSDGELEKAWAGVPDPIQVANPIFSSEVFIRWHPLTNHGPSGWREGDLRHLWIVAPVLNDEIPRLVTDRATEYTFWRYSNDELAKGNWHDFRTYDRSREVPDSENPIHAVMYYHPPKEPPNLVNFPAFYKFPKLPRALWTSNVWKYSERIGAVEAAFAKVDGAIYLVIYDGQMDTMYVADVSRPPGDDVCYLDSTLSSALLKSLSANSLPR